jgi:hypothetical protein
MASTGDKDVVEELPQPKVRPHMNERIRFFLSAFLILGIGASVQELVLAANASTPPSITTQPANITVKIGATATFKVVASGTAPLSYQWYSCSSYPASLIKGAISSSYVTPATTDADNGKCFYVTVSNTGGSVNSNYAYLTVVEPPSIYQQPQSLVVTAPAVATFTVYARGTYPLTYQWYKNGVLIPGAIDYAYTSSETTTADNGAKFTVIISNSWGKVASAPAILTVNPFNGTGTYPIVGEWSGTATTTFASGSARTSPVVAGFTQNSYSLVGTIVFVDDYGIPTMGSAIASLNNLNLFTVTEGEDGAVPIAAGFSSNLMNLSGGAAAFTGDFGGGTMTLSSDKRTLTGSATVSDGTKISWKLTRTK